MHVEPTATSSGTRPSSGDNESLASVEVFEDSSWFMRALTYDPFPIKMYARNHVCFELQHRVHRCVACCGTGMQCGTPLRQRSSSTCRWWLWLWPRCVSSISSASSSLLALVRCRAHSHLLGRPLMNLSCARSPRAQCTTLDTSDALSVFAVCSSSRSSPWRTAMPACSGGRRSCMPASAHRCHGVATLLRSTR